VRINGLLLVNKPCIIAVTIVCDKASPASAAAMVCGAVPTMRALRQMKTIFAILKQNKTSGSKEK
jgi:hypothetical protein